MGGGEIWAKIIISVVSGPSGHVQSYKLEERWNAEPRGVPLSPKATRMPNSLRNDLIGSRQNIFSKYTLLRVAFGCMSLRNPTCSDSQMTSENII